MLINGVGFNEEWARTITAEEFVDTFAASDLPEEFGQGEERKAKLNKSYKLLTGTGEKKETQEEK